MKTIKPKKMSEKVKQKRLNAAKMLQGIWSDLPKSVLKELLKKSY